MVQPIDGPIYWIGDTVRDWNGAVGVVQSVNYISRETIPNFQLERGYQRIGVAYTPPVLIHTPRGTSDFYQSWTEGASSNYQPVECVS